jgi:hypothetical protein
MHKNSLENCIQSMVIQKVKRLAEEPSSFEIVGCTATVAVLVVLNMTNIFENIRCLMKTQIQINNK